MHKLGLTLLYLASILVFIGGLGDQFISNYLDVHLSFLGNPEPSDLLVKSEILSMLLLHSTGGGLMSTGLGMFALTHFGVRNSQRWTKWTLLIMALIAQGINGYGMYTVGSYFWFPIGVFTITLFGVLLCKMKKPGQ